MQDNQFILPRAVSYTSPTTLIPASLLLHWQITWQTITEETRMSGSITMPELLPQTFLFICCNYLEQMGHVYSTKKPELVSQCLPY